MSSRQGGTFRIEYDSRARRQLDRINPHDYEQIGAKIRDLASEPLPRRSLKLRDGSHRIRVGNWRVFYLTDNSERVVVITDVLRRNEATYRDL